jgi:hypothetical protein
MIDLIYPMLGMFAGMVVGKIAAQYVLLIIQFRDDDYSLENDIENDKIRRNFARTCNTALWNLSENQRLRS